MNTMVPVGTKGDYEVYSVVPCSIENAMQMEAEVTTHYQHDTAGIYGSGDDILTKKITVGGKEYEYVQFGDDDQAPYRNQQLIEQNMVMSRCQEFNIMTCYGQGLRYLDRETKKATEDPEIRRFCLQNAIHRLWLRMSTDIKYHYFSVLVIHLSRDHKKVVMVRARNAADCRFTKRNSYGCIEHVLVGDFKQANPERIEAIPLLDEVDPLGDLMYRMGSAPGIYTGESLPAPMDGKDCKFAILCAVPTPGYRYYPVPPHASIYRDAWYDIYRLIGIGKRYMIKNTAAPRIQVEVHRSYWDNVCNEEGITDKAKRKDRIKKERDDITEFCTKPENAGKAWITSYDMTPDGKEKRMVRVYNLVDGNKKEGGDWSEDMSEAANSLCFAMGVHPNMVGATPGKAQMNNSGSDKRELFTLKQAIEKAFHDVMEVPFHVINYYNGWEDRFALDVPMIQLTTIDENKDAKETKVDADGNNDNSNEG
ncbi:MAG: hypothetical protein IJ868_00540 [Prevotella sp.]|nr:hypothetical protein [Prevotella sp.]